MWEGQRSTIEQSWPDDQTLTLMLILILILDGPTLLRPASSYTRYRDYRSMLNGCYLINSFFKLKQLIPFNE